MAPPPGASLLEIPHTPGGLGGRRCESSRRALRRLSVVVGVDGRSCVIEKVSGIERRAAGVEHERVLTEVETVREIISQSVRVSQRRHAVGPFDEVEDAAKIVGYMRNIAGFGIGRDDD